MNLPDDEIRKLKEAGFLHDIGKIALGRKILKEIDTLTNQTSKQFQQHPVVGYRILNSFDNTLDLAIYVLAHHENWDGSGYPKGLRREEIPMLARILRIAGCFDSMTNKLRDNPISKKDAIREIQKQSGIKFDPKIVQALARVTL